MGEFILPDMTKAHVYMEDFDYYNALDWTVTEVGTATQALADEDGGALLITNSAADNDSSFQNKLGESFLMATGKKAWFKSRLKVSDATQSAFIFGIQITDTTPLSVSDGIFFRKDDGDANLDFLVIKNGSATSSNIVTVLSDDAYFEAAWYYNGVDSIVIFIDDVAVASVATDNLPDDEVLTVSFGIENGAAASKSMTVDYVMTAKER